MPENNVDELRASLTKKLNKARALLSPDKSMLDVYVAANLTDDELWVLAHTNVNNDRTSMEWEGFYVSDLKAHQFVIRRYESLKKRIEAQQLRGETKIQMTVKERIQFYKDQGLTVSELLHHAVDGLCPDEVNKYHDELCDLTGNKTITNPKVINAIEAAERGETTEFGLVYIKVRNSP